MVANEDNPEVFRMDYKGLIYSFMLSVGNDTIWKSVIENTAKSCFEQFDGANEGYECKGLLGFTVVKDYSLISFIPVIPLELYRIIDCSYTENYIRCPTLNTHPDCVNTMNFVKKCLRGDD
jgi:hypothetical protein